MRKCFMPVNKFREGIVFMKLKHASVFILAIVLIGFVSIYLTNTQKDVQEARRGQVLVISLMDIHLKLLVEVILLKYVLFPLQILKGLFYDLCLPVSPAR